MKATPSIRKAAPKKTAQKKTAPKKRGNMKPSEIQPLIMAALHAYGIQNPGISFDDWRAEQVIAAVNLPGLSTCDSKHFCSLMGHFKLAAGLDDEAMHWFMRDGKNSERQLAWSIVTTLKAHVALANATVELITAATPPRLLQRRLDRHAAIHDHPEGPLNIAYLVSIIAMKTGRHLDPATDLKITLADRCTIPELVGIRNTLVNRISEREGVGHTSNRNRSQNSDAAKERRSPHTLAPRY